MPVRYPSELVDFHLISNWSVDSSTDHSRHQRGTNYPKHFDHSSQCNFENVLEVIVLEKTARSTLPRLHREFELKN